jgi:hypothetical protein
VEVRASKSGWEGGDRKWPRSGGSRDGVHTYADEEDRHEIEKTSRQQGIESAIDAFKELIHPVLTCCYRYVRVRIQSFS